MEFKFQVCLLMFMFTLSVTKAQINITEVTKLVSEKANECFENRMDRIKVMAKALAMVIKGDIGEQSSKLKCTSKCVMQSFGLMDVNGGLQPQTFRKVVGMALNSNLILKNIVLDRVDCCIEEAKAIEDSCQQSAFVIMCTAKSGVLTMTNLPGAVVEGVKSIPSMLTGKYKKCANMKA